MEEVKAVNDIDSHYSRPIKYRPPPNRIVHSEKFDHCLLLSVNKFYSVGTIH